MLMWAGWPGLGAEAVRRVPEWREASVLELDRQGLIEDEVGHGFAVCWIEGRRLVEEEVTLGRATSGGNRRWPVGQLEVEEDGRIGNPTGVLRQSGW
jgi:hypothetical protein